MVVPFNKPYITPGMSEYIIQSVTSGKTSGDGPFTTRCQSWLESYGGHKKVLLTHSCTAALELAAILCDIGPGDEFIVPSYTFVSSANAFVLRGATPVFVDVRSDNLNLDEQQLESHITPRTKVIVPVHYAGVACEMDSIMAVADRFNLIVVEDAAQALMSSYKGRPLGSIGHIGCLSFHETKNISCGEGGALLLNDSRFIKRAEIIREKGTDRSQFLRGEVDKYTWIDVGSSFLPSDILAAILLSQLESATEITSLRKKIWHRYYDAFIDMKNLVDLPNVSASCFDNAHIFFILNKTENHQEVIIRNMRNEGVRLSSHYVPLHDSPYGKKFRKSTQQFPVTDAISSQIIRFPMWAGMSETEQDHVIHCFKRIISDY